MSVAKKERKCITITDYYRSGVYFQEIEYYYFGEHCSCFGNHCSYFAQQGKKLQEKVDGPQGKAEQI